MQRILFSNTGCHYSETRANLPKKKKRVFKKPVQNDSNEKMKTWQKVFHLW